MKLTLPSGRKVTVAKAATPRSSQFEASSGIFAAARDLFASGLVTLHDERDQPIDVDTLALGDFHALRAIAVRLGFLLEDPVSIDCRNCGETIAHRPSASLPLGPFEDGELHDDELDRPLPFGVAHPAASLGDLVLGPITLAEAAPLHAALTRRTLRISAAIVRAMGIASLAGESDARKIASRLARAKERDWGRVTDLFVLAHYPPRLFSIAVCPHCSARNDVDAPYDREFEPSGEPSEKTGEESSIHVGSNEQSFPSFDAFDRAANEIAAPLLRDPSAAGVALVIDDDVPVVDDGGEPLLGSFVPGYEGDMGTPSRAPEITLFYRTFRAVWDEEGPYDWRAEIEETIAHELDHHRADLEGDDPVDDEERAEIERERGRVLGKKAVARGEVRALIGDVRTFLVRTWPIWILLLVATLIAAYGDVR